MSENVAISLQDPHFSSTLPFSLRMILHDVGSNPLGVHVDWFRNLLQEFDMFDVNTIRIAEPFVIVSKLNRVMALLGSILKHF